MLVLACGTAFVMVAILDLWVLDRMLLHDDAKEQQQRQDPPEEIVMEEESKIHARLEERLQQLAQLLSVSPSARSTTPDRSRLSPFRASLLKGSPARTAETVDETQYLYPEDEYEENENEQNVDDLGEGDFALLDRSMDETTMSLPSPLRRALEPIRDEEEDNIDVDAGLSQNSSYIAQPRQEFMEALNPSSNSNANTPTRSMLPRRLLMREPSPSPIRMEGSPRRVEDEPPVPPTTPEREDQVLLVAAERLKELMTIRGSLTQLTSLYSEVETLSVQLTERIQKRRRAQTFVARALQCRYRRRRLSERLASRLELRMAVRLQSWIRMRRCAQQWRRKQKASRRIQAAWQIVMRCKRKREAITLLQQLYRGYAVRTKLRRYISSIVKLQATARTKARRKEYVQQIFPAICLVQQVFRACRQRKHFLKLVHGLVKIQTLQRRKLAKRIVLRRRESIGILQTAIRKYQAKKRLQSRQRQEFHAAVLVQTSFRQHENRQRFMVKKRACVSIQSTARGMSVRSKLSGQKVSATTIQALVRFKSASATYQKQRLAVATIQSAYRRYRRQKKVHLSAIQIQTVVRRRRAQRDWQRNIRAILSLQAWSRSFLARKKYSIFLASLVELQKFYRARQQLQNLKMDKSRLEATIKLQAAVRQTQAARRYQAEKAKAQRRAMNASSLQIQCLIRGHLAKKSFETKIRSTIRLQEWARSRIARRRFCSFISSVIQMQYLYRLGQQRRKVGSKLRTRAATRLQSSFRRWLAIRRIERHQAAIRLQAIVRCYLVKNKSRTTDAERSDDDDDSRDDSSTEQQDTNRPSLLDNITNRLQSSPLAYLPTQYLGALRHPMSPSGPAGLDYDEVYDSNSSTPVAANRPRQSLQALAHPLASLGGSPSYGDPDSPIEIGYLPGRYTQAPTSRLAPRGPAGLDYDEIFNSNFTFPSSRDESTHDVESILKLQALVRSFLQRRRMASEQKVLASIGSEEDPNAERGNQVLDEAAAAMIQRWFRALLVRKQHSAAALTLQKHYRAHRTRLSESVTPKRKGKGKSVRSKSKRNERAERIAKSVYQKWRETRFPVDSLRTLPSLLEDEHIYDIFQDEERDQRQAQLAVLRVFGQISSKRHSAAWKLQQAYHRRRLVGPPNSAAKENARSTIADECIEFVPCLNAREIKNADSDARNPPGHLGNAIQTQGPFAPSVAPAAS